MISLLWPAWPAPGNVRAVVTTRQGGCSAEPFASLNLADHVGDDPARVAQNRALIARECGLPKGPFWLEQVHGTRVVSPQSAGPGCRADAVYSDLPGVVCAVLTADCLPLLITDRMGREVCAVHAGWRGLAAGVIENAVRRFSSPAGELLAWLGPAIGPAAFEVGAEVRDAFIEHRLESGRLFTPNRPDHWLADLSGLARMRLADTGVGFVCGGDYCTLTQDELFFSYRRDGVTGRMAAMIWFE
ncbi:MAG: peptidoglycan editing factor PgeF [Candidatus Thiodiazotropha sp. (ex Ctena orbiculata)]|nr:peptidoglycan editing factor PgeF [Candidatus Thiodiazotropha taylori]MBT2996041.1 peptidoglycan editing factor PgeF [Candidatus Thiodiazotropha taylori]MBT3001591.1 peptidoglycan editing factor PgeF [Candidatus Thiodiazotropha taylori]MBT3025875.1 peptidoglycan editing factor PgeF [Candidatus Thiodiazotropha taylori]MBT3033652.1 peptidoglycan editing factor PgeF [Candidatus Thiodiazotropha taylori]